uniref:Serum amyloid A protein n=1 Tax=Rhinolophus ferrumequinum TaxID=59479 RepID=A0A671G833_RHIFE
MKLFIGLVFCSLVLGVSSENWFSFMGEAAQGAWDMLRAYSDMREANYIGADKYFQSGRWGCCKSALSHLLRALLHYSNLRENSQRVTDLFKYGDSGHGEEDSKADQFANEWGRSGKDPNHFRPDGLPDEY